VKVITQELLRKESLKEKNQRSWGKTSTTLCAKIKLTTIQLKKIMLTVMNKQKKIQILKKMYKIPKKLNQIMKKPMAK